jgi:aryl carrier-like protein
MADINLDLIMQTLHRIQSEQRTLRDENRLINKRLDSILMTLLDRMAESEAHINIRFDDLEKLLNK